MTTLYAYCPNTGKSHKEHPDEYLFCPDCAMALHASTASERSLPVREKQEPIVIDDSPGPKAANQAVYIPAAATQLNRTNPPPADAWQKAQTRTAAAEERRRSILRTQQAKPRTFSKDKGKELNLVIKAYLIPAWNERYGFGSTSSSPYGTYMYSVFMLVR